MGTDSEPRSLRIEANGERLGTEWGLGPFTIKQTTEDVTAIHRWAASRLQGRRRPRHRPLARAPERRFAGRPARRSMTRAERAVRNGPEPGHLTRRRARSERKAGGAFIRRANAIGAPARPRRSAKGSLVPDDRGESQTGLGNVGECSLPVVAQPCTNERLGGGLRRRIRGHVGRAGSARKSYEGKEHQSNRSHLQASLHVRYTALSGQRPYPMNAESAM
jgi:hypothetical protein